MTTDWAWHSNTTFIRDDGREVDVRVTWDPSDPSVGIMHPTPVGYELDEGEPPLTEAEEKRLDETVELPDYD